MKVLSINRFLIFISSILVSFTLSAQYTVTGIVRDAETKEPLPGAAIIIEGLNKGTTTDLDGTFSISSIHNKKISLKITYISYDAEIVVCDFATNPNIELNIKLKPSSTSIEQVEVKAVAHGQVKALIEQRIAENIKNIVSSEQIEEFPDLSAAEAMQRIPGITLQRDQGDGKYVQLRGTPPELTNFNINGEQIPSPEGDVRYVGMDIISADQIETIEITKVLTPDMDADGIGGTVNIVTKMADTEEPEINASMAGGYNNLRESGNYQIQYSHGQRIGNFGFNMNASYYENHQGSDNMEYKYDKSTFWGSQGDGQDNYHIQYREVQLRHYTITRKRTALSATMDYNFSEKSQIYLRGMYNDFIDDETRRRIIYDLDDAVSETYYLYGGIDRDVKDRTKEQSVSSINFGGLHDINLFKIDYEIAYSVAKEAEPDRLETTFDSPGQAIAIKFDLSDPDWPIASFPNEAQAENAYNYAEYEMNELLLQESTVRDANLTAKINFAIPYESALGNGYLKFGGKSRMKDKSREAKVSEFSAYNERSAIYPDVADELVLTTVEDNFSETNLLNRGYVIDHIPSPALMRDFYEYNSHHFIFDRNATKTKSFGEDYNANEDIYAAYGMIKHNFRNFMVLIGGRFERTEIDYVGKLVKTDSITGIVNEIVDLPEQKTVEDFFPQIQLKYSINSKTNIRAAVTKTFSRPNFEDVIPFRQQERDEVKYGNRNLEYPVSINVDFLAEKYFDKGGLISGGLFYKKIDNFVYECRVMDQGDGFGGGRLEVEFPYNGIEANVFGFEWQTQFNFTFLPQPFQNIGFFANYTFTHSNSEIYKRLPANNHSDVIEIDSLYNISFINTNDLENIPLPGQAKHTANVALYYEGEVVYAKISANYHDAFLDVIGADADLDEYYDQSLHIDFTASVKLNDYLKLFADVKNLTNAPLKYYLGTPDRIKKQEFYSWWARIGVKLNF